VPERNARNPATRAGQNVASQPGGQPSVRMPIAAANRGTTMLTAKKTARFHFFSSVPNQGQYSTTMDHRNPTATWIPFGWDRYARNSDQELGPTHCCTSKGFWSAAPGGGYRTAPIIHQVYALCNGCPNSKNLGICPEILTK